jgi:hypothetical protein
VIRAFVPVVVLVLMTMQTVYCRPSRQVNHHFIQSKFSFALSIARPPFCVQFVMTGLVANPDCFCLVAEMFG